MSWYVYLVVFVFALLTAFHTIGLYESAYSVHVLPTGLSQLFYHLDWHYGMLGVLDVVYLATTAALMHRTPPVLWPGILGFSLAAFWPWIAVWNTVLSVFATNRPIERGPRMTRFFPPHVTLETQWQVVRAEADRLVAAVPALCMRDVIPRTTLLDLDTPRDKCWKWYTILDHRGVNPDALTHMPHTVGMLSSMRQVLSASISILEPHTSLLPHVGYSKGLLRYHLGLRIPAGNTLTVDGQTYQWREGEGVLFDDMYVHSVINPSNDRRMVLYIDVMRNDLPLPLQSLNAMLFQMAASLFAGADERTHKAAKNVSKRT